MADSTGKTVSVFMMEKGSADLACLKCLDRVFCRPPGGPLLPVSDKCGRHDSWFLGTRGFRQWKNFLRKEIGEEARDLGRRRAAFRAPPHFGKPCMHDDTTVAIRDPARLAETVMRHAELHAEHRQFSACSVVLLRSPVPRPGFPAAAQGGLGPVGDRGRPRARQESAHDRCDRPVFPARDRRGMPLGEAAGHGRAGIHRGPGAPHGAARLCNKVFVRPSWRP